MTSAIDPTVFPDNQQIDKADIRDQFTIAKNEITALQEDMPIADAKVVYLSSYLDEVNPLQAAVNAIGTAGAIIVPSGVTVIPGPVVGGGSWAASSLRSIMIVGENTDSVLEFPNTGGGLALYMSTPSNTEMARDRVYISNVSFITTHLAAEADALNGSGTALSISYPIAVGDVTSGVVIRDVQVGCKTHDRQPGDMFQWWDTGIQLYNARQVTIANTYLWGAFSDPVKGIGLDLNGGTVEVHLSDLNVAEFNTGVWANGVTEGVQWTRGVMIGCINGFVVDGDAVGRARSTSTTSHTIGTGSKTFIVAHNIQGSAGLAWGSVNAFLRIRDANNPLTNYMNATVTSFTTNTVTVNVTSVVGSGSSSNWTLSTEHRISQIVVDSVHSNNKLRNYSLRWAAFAFFNNLMMQPRDDGDMVDFWHFEFLQQCSGVFFDNTLLSSLTDTGQPKGGIAIRGTYTPNYTSGGNAAENYYFHINNITFTEAAHDTGILIENNTQIVMCSNIMGLGAFSNKMIDNQVTSAGAGIRIVDSLPMTATSAWTAFTASDATPSIAADGNNRWITANAVATSITAFDNGYVGQEFAVLIGDSGSANTTFVHSAGLLMREGIDYTPTSGTLLRFIRESSTIVRELSRSMAGIQYAAQQIFGGGLTNGFFWSGWLYNTANRDTVDPSASWTQGLALGYNYNATGEINYVARNGGPHLFQNWDGAAMVNWWIQADFGVFDRYAKTTALTVATLPSAAAVGAGARAFVTDANSATFMAAVVGGGANAVPVHSDGAGWFIG